MNVIQGSSLSAESEPAPSSAQPGSGVPYGSYGSGPEGPYGSGGGGNWSGGNWSGGNWSGGGSYGGPPPSPRRHRRGRVLAFGAAGLALAAAVSVGSYDAVQGGGGTSATVSAATQLSTSQIATKVSPGLVDIVSTLGYDNASAAGTGMVLTSTGEVLTNNHVINGATSISVTDIGNGQTYKATVVGYDDSQDVAVLQLQNASGLQTVSVGNSSSVSVGQKVVAIGNAEGKGGTPSVVTGTVTALGQSITASDEGSASSEQLSGLIQSNAPIQPGDSGGSLVNSAGQVVGMDTAASTSSATPTAQVQSPGQTQQQGQTATQAFSIPINQAESIASQIEAGSASSTVHLGTTGFLGIEVAPSSASQGGVGGGTGSGTGGIGGYGGGFGYGGYGSSGTATSGATVEGTVSGSPAAQAGLAAGDVITSINGQSITDPSQIQSILGSYHPGDKVSVTWTNADGQSQTASIALATGPAA